MRRLLPAFFARGIVSRTGLALLDIRFRVAWRHQPHRVAELAQFPAPMMSCRTGLNTDQSGAKAREEFQHLATAQCLADNDLAASINAVNLENLLGEIELDCRNLVQGALPFDVCHNDHPGPQMPSGGRSTPSN
jgi:hypothetical protein